MSNVRTLDLPRPPESLLALIEDIDENDINLFGESSGLRWGRIRKQFGGNVPPTHSRYDIGNRIELIARLQSRNDHNMIKADEIGRLADDLEKNTVTFVYGPHCSGKTTCVCFIFNVF